MYEQHGGVLANSHNSVSQICCLLEVMVQGGDHIGSVTVSTSKEGSSNFATCLQVSEPEDLFSSGVFLIGR